MRPYQIPSVGGEGEGESVIAVDDIITAEDQGDLIEANNEEYQKSELGKTTRNDQDHT